jgi:hypothetical protein
MATRRNTGFYRFLEDKGLLGAEAASIALARQEYRALYKAQWRKLQRAKVRAITVYLDKASNQVLSQAARCHKRSVTRFLREAALSYVQKRFLFPDLACLYEIKGLLVLNYTGLCNLLKQAAEIEAGAHALKLLLDLEQQILTQLQFPKECGNDS